MQPMEKGKTAKRSPPPELPRRSFIYGPLLAGVTRTETHRRCTRVGNPAASVLSSPSYLVWLLLAAGWEVADGWMDGWVGPPVRRPVRALCFRLCCQECMIEAPFRCQNFQIPRHIESLNTCMKH
jgi:hypothetical protein